MPQESKIIFIVLAGTLLLLLFGSFIVFFALAYQRRQNKYLQEKKQLQDDFESEILKSRIEMQEQTMQHISQEIHDNIGQVLSLAKLNLNTIYLENRTLTEEKISNTKQLITNAIHDLRSLSKSLDTDTIADKGLLVAIENELEMIKKSGSFTTNLRVEGSPYRLERKKEVILFRIVQEVMNNIIKHAEASNINIRLVYLNNRFELLIEDDGQGFETGTAMKENKGGGLGLKNMHNRAALAGGKFILTSAPGKGTQVSIQLPISNI